jgi:hypothetical protein
MRLERRMPLSERAHNKACTKILIYFFLILAGTDTGQFGQNLEYSANDLQVIIKQET